MPDKNTFWLYLSNNFLNVLLFTYWWCGDCDVGICHWHCQTMTGRLAGGWISHQYFLTGLLFKIITFCKRQFGENSKDQASGFLKNWSVLSYKCHLTKVLSTLSYSVMNTMCFGSLKSGSVCPHALEAFCSSKKDAPLWEWYTSRSSPRSHDSIFIQHLYDGKFTGNKTKT